MSFASFGVLLQIVAQGFAHGLLHGAGHLAVAQFGFGLSFELRFGHFDGDDGGRPSRKSSPEISTLFFLQFLQFLGIFVLCIFLRVRVRAVRKPAKCVPPSMVLMLFT